MDLIIQQGVQLKNAKKYGEFFTARKTYKEVNFLPRIGEIVEDSVYHRNDPNFKVENATINYESNYYLADIAPYIIDSEDKNRIEEIKKIYSSHGWEVLNA